MEGAAPACVYVAAPARLSAQAEVLSAEKSVTVSVTVAIKLIKFKISYLGKNARPVTLSPERDKTVTP